MSDILKRIKKITGNDYAFQMTDQHNPYVVDRWIDTGCYALNCVVGNGDIMGGVAEGKRVCFAGPSSTAKSYLAAHVVKSYLDQTPNSYVVFFETEGSSIADVVKSLKIPEERLIVLPVATVEEFKVQSVRLLDQILEDKKKDKDAPNFMMVLDSIGMLGSRKEYEDAIKGDDKVDLTRQKAIKSVFRLITLKLTLSKTPLIVVAHTYQTIEMFSKNKVSGGTGLDYAADTILILTKAKEREGTDHIGALITLNVEKSRWIPEGQKIKVLLLFKRGLYKYSSLFDIGYEEGLIVKEGKQYIMPDGQKAFKKTIMNDGERFYTEEVLEKLREVVLAKYSFGGGDDGTVTMDEMIGDSDDDTAD